MTEVLYYRLPWKSSSVYPGAHSGQMIGAGQLFKRHEPLIASPDPRRIDIRTTLLDPFGNYRVRVYQQQSTVNVYLVADLSASMSYANKKLALIKILVSVANSAFSYGDKFGFIGCTEHIAHQWLLPPGVHQGSVKALAEKLQQARFTGTANGLPQAAAYLSAARSLIFLLSDCHFPIEELRKLLKSLKAHDVIPIVLWDQNETINLPEWGFVSYQDMENSATRTLFMRPALRQKMIESYQQRQDDLKRCFRAYGFEPIFINEAFSTQSINCYLQQRTA